MKKIVAVMPIKLNNERLPGKNIKSLGGKPLLCHELEMLLQIPELDSVNVYCSDEKICDYLPEKVKFIKRPSFLDLPQSNFTQIFETFMETEDADIYIYAHATAPYITKDTVMKCLDAVKSEKFDSAFCAVRIQDFLWKDGKPLNFDAANIPRRQDLPVIYRETSGVYVFAKKVFQQLKRRVGENPYICEVSFRESIDINTAEDFELAEKYIKDMKY